MTYRQILILKLCKTCAHPRAKYAEVQNYRALTHRGLIHRSTLDHRWRITLESRRCETRK